MPLLLTPEQELIKQVVREFAEKELATEATAIDRASRFPRAHYTKMAPLGLLGLLLPAEQGGAGVDTLSYAVAVEEVARGSGTDAALLILQNAMVAHLLAGQASESQRADLLAPSVAGARIGAVAITEEASGAPLADILTTAAPQPGGGYLLRGSKAFVSLAGAADFYLVLAQVPSAGPALVAVPADAPGLHFGDAESKLGLRGLPMAEMYLNRVPVAARDVVGEPGTAHVRIVDALRLSRLGVAAGLIGLTQAALEMSVGFARSRHQFGQPIVNFGVIRGFLADIQAQLEAARATAYGAAALRDAGKDFALEAYEALLLANEVAVKGTRLALKVHGGAGFMRDLPLERVARDVRTLMHMWGGRDITRSRLANQFLGDPAPAPTPRL